MHKGALAFLVSTPTLGFYSMFGGVECVYFIPKTKNYFDLMNKVIVENFFSFKRYILSLSFVQKIDKSFRFLRILLIFRSVNN